MNSIDRVRTALSNIKAEAKRTDRTFIGMYTTNSLDENEANAIVVVKGSTLEMASMITVLLNEDSMKNVKRLVTMELLKEMEKSDG